MQDLNEQLIRAVVEEDLAEVERLVSEGADINYTDFYNNCAVFTAAWEGNIAALELYHRLGAHLDLNDNNPLCNAAYNGKAESVKWLLANGANPNHIFSTGENALHYTLSNTNHMPERTEIVKALIAAGTDVNKTTIKGLETLCFMRDARLKAETPLHRAAAYANAEIVQALIDAGADITAKDSNGDTPISWASWFLRDSDVLRLLVYEGVAGVG